jgi:hypothetical protein
MRDVAALDAPMRDVAGLKQPMEQVATLREPMKEVSKLSAPMEEISQLGGDSSRQTGLVALGLLGWGVVTFLGVYFGVQAGNRRQQRLAQGDRDSSVGPAPAEPPPRVLSESRSFERRAQIKSM